jgi:Ca2+-binding EF-hand superfamily protein
MFRSTFDDFDADKSGEVDLNELVAMCAAMEMKVPKKTLKKLMDHVDSDGSGSVDFVEFVEMMEIGKRGMMSNIFYEMAHKHEIMADEKRRSVMKKRQAALAKKVIALEKKSLKSSMRADAKKTLSKLELAACKKTFETINIDGSGALDEEELREAFKTLGLELSKKEVRHVFKKVDIDGDGTLDMDEYIICVAMCKSSNKYGRAFQALAEAGSKLKTNSEAREKMEKKKQKNIEKKQREAEKAANRAEFRAATRKKFPKAQVQRLRNQFDVIDSDSSGELDMGELQDLFIQLGVVAEGSMESAANRKKIRTLMREVDDDGSGTVDFDEFLSLYMKIIESSSGFLAVAKKRVAEEATSGDGGLSLDMATMEDKARERREQREAQREALRKKAEEQAELYKVFTKKEVERLKEMFDRLDTDRSGTLDREEMCDGILENPNVSMTEEEMESALLEIDTDGDGTLDWVEFLQMCKRMQEGKTTEGGRILMSAGEQKLQQANARRNQAQDDFAKQKKMLNESLLGKEKKAIENRVKMLARKSDERSKKAVSRKERAEAARRRRVEKGGGGGGVE